MEHFFYLIGILYFIVSAYNFKPLTTDIISVVGSILFINYFTFKL